VEHPGAGDLSATMMGGVGMPRFVLFWSLGLMAVGLGAVPTAAADDPSIRGEQRDQIQAAMTRFVAEQSVEGVVRIYDPVDGKLLRLRLDEVHEGIVRKGDFFVSCADFRDQDGRRIDVDFLVIERGDGLVATQGVVHSVDGNKRKYHLE
jgi:hypothetical protein